MWRCEPNEPLPPQTALIMMSRHSAVTLGQINHPGLKQQQLVSFGILHNTWLF